MPGNKAEYSDIQKYVLDSQSRLRETVIFRDDFRHFIEADRDPTLTDEAGGWWYRVTTRTRPSSGAAFGSMGKYDAGKAQEAFYTSADTFAQISVDHKVFALDSAAVQIPGVPSIVRDKVNEAIAELGYVQDLALRGSHSGILALCHDVPVDETYEGQQVSRIYLDPWHAHKTWYPESALDFFMPGSEGGGRVQFVAYDLDDPLNPTMVDSGPDDDGYGYRVMHQVKAFTAGGCYIDVFPRVGPHVANGMAVVKARSLNACPFGLYDICGDGTNPGGNHPRYGARYFGYDQDRAPIDCQADGMNFMRAPVFNTITQLHAGGINVQPVLSNSLLTKMYNWMKDTVDPEPSYNALVMSTAMAERMGELASADKRPFVTPEGYVVGNLGVRLPGWTAPDGKMLAIVTPRRWNTGDILMAPFSDLGIFVQHEGWDPGPIHGVFERMLRTTNDNSVKAVYSRYQMIVPHTRRAWMMARNVKTTA